MPGSVSVTPSTGPSENFFLREDHGDPLVHEDVGNNFHEPLAEKNSNFFTPFEALSEL
jgi:hypothetical protein